MKVTATYQGKKHSVKLKQGSSVKDLLEEMGINPETVLVGKNSEIVPDTEPLGEGDSIEIIRAISGG